MLMCEPFICTTLIMIISIILEVKATTQSLSLLINNRHRLKVPNHFDKNLKHQLKLQHGGPKY